ncbi:MAG: hypothetical protein HFE04_00710 [Bacilli bacterium]|nr:hypothetical protein [Bacilli bacterium]
MKKIFTIITIIILSLFLLINALSGKENANKYKEEYKRIYFSSLNSKKINELFYGLKGTIIEVEIKTKKFTKAYRLNTSMTNNIEEKLSQEVLKDLKETGDLELAAVYKTSGFIITRIDIICTKEIENIIKERSKR